MLTDFGGLQTTAPHALASLLETTSQIFNGTLVSLALEVHLATSGPTITQFSTDMN